MSERKKTRKELFLEEFEEKIKRNKKEGFIMVFIKVPNSHGYELVVNVRENFEHKRDYYINNYDNELRLIANKDVFIDDWFFGDKELNRVSMSNYLISIQAKSAY